MRFVSSYSSGTVQVCAQFGAPGPGDLLSLCLDPISGRGSAILHCDAGLPIRQPTKIECSAEGTLLSRMHGDAQQSHSVRALAEALAIAAYVEATGQALCAEPVSARQAAGATLLDELTGRSNSNAPQAGGRLPSSASLQLPSAYAEFVCANDGLLFYPAGDILRVGEMLSLTVSHDISALNAAPEAERVAAELGLAADSHAISLETARDALCAIPWPSAAAVCYFGDAAHECHAWRLQAAAAYPLLAARIAETSSWRDAVDGGAPVAGLICEDTGLNRTRLKRLAKLTVPPPFERLFDRGEFVRGNNAIGVDRQRRYRIGTELTLDGTLGLFRDIDAGQLPRNDSEWMDFADIASACAMPICTAFELPLNQILAASRGDWRRFLASLAGAADVKIEEFDRYRIALTTIDMLEAVEDYCNTVLLAATMSQLEDLPPPAPLILDRARRMAFSILAGQSRNPAGQLYSLTRRWLTRIPALIDAESCDSSNRVSQDPDHWPQLSPSFRTDSGVLVQNLASRADLKEESHRMRNCVGRLYLRPAMRGDCHIFSVRDETGQISHSTFEVAPPTGSHDAALANIRIVQHKGYRNSKPSDLAKAGCAAWLKAVRSGKLTLDLAATEEWRQEASQLHDHRASHDAAGNRSAWIAQIGPALESPLVRERIQAEWHTHILHRKSSSPANHRTISPSDLFDPTDTDA